MKSDSGKTDSIWTSTADVPLYLPLTADEQANVCVIGAGIAGMTSAYLLAREGKSVVVLDDGHIAGGETGRTTAHLVNVLDDRYYEIERMHGEKGARLAAESHTEAVNEIERICKEENIDCDFLRVDGYLFNPPTGAREILIQELEAVHRAGILDATMVEKAPLPGFDTGAAIRFPNQAQFHPVKYLAGLAKAIERAGGKIFTRTHAEKIESGSHPVVTSTEGRRVRCNHIVVATNTPVNDWVTIHTKQAAYRTYVIGVHIPRGSVPTALYWDTPDPYHYVRLQPLSDRHDVLIVGGEDHKTGQAHDTDARFDRLEEWARQRFTGIESVAYRWSGQIMEPIDSLAFIGRNPGDECVYIATGDSGNGMTHGTIAGMLITDLIQKRENEWAKLYEPSRKPLRAAGEFAKENFNVARQYVELATGGDVGSVDDIAPDSGAVVRRGFQKIAAYRDASGELHEFSAICPHLGCVVDWNATESTWDCPCHGSRFDTNGCVINGPANTDLSPTDDNDEGVSPIPIAIVPQ
ncbi:MAG: FAD-dependent oxidoreductase [Bryobacteraceae bacterium]